MVYFFTEITENDLLNATFDNSETLPKNSAALESVIPTKDGALAIAFIGGAYYFKIVRNKKEDFIEDEDGEDEEEYENEDEEPEDGSTERDHSIKTRLAKAKEQQPTVAEGKQRRTHSKGKTNY